MSMEIWVFNFDQKDLPTFSLKCLEEESLMVSYQNEPQLIVDLDQFASTKNLSERKLNQRDIWTFVIRFLGWVGFYIGF